MKFSARSESVHFIKDINSTSIQLILSFESFNRRDIFSRTRLYCDLNCIRQQKNICIVLPIGSDHEILALIAFSNDEGPLRRLARAFAARIYKNMDVDEDPD